MKRFFSNLALVFAITLMAILSSACGGNNDYDDSNYKSTEYTYYITTDKIYIDSGSPYTKEQLAKVYGEELNKECHDNWIDYNTLFNAIANIYIINNMEAKIKYIHGTTTIMCHVKSTNKEIAIFNYNFDQNIILHI